MLYDLITDPSLANAGFLLFDVAAAAIPFVPGTYVAKGGTAVAKVVSKVASRIDDAVDLAKAGRKLTRVQDALVAISKAEKLTVVMKDALRAEARKMMKGIIDLAQSMGKTIDIHHLIPLEYAHLMGTTFDPNDMMNLAGVITGWIVRK